jgi:hypothetical protein
MKDKGCSTQKYGLHYTSSPGKSFLIEPEGGELNYELAYRDPLGFYNQVMTQNVTQHKAKDYDSPKRNGCYQVELTTKVTHRQIGKILLLVQNQLHEYLSG